MDPSDRRQNRYVYDGVLSLFICDLWITETQFWLLIVSKHSCMQCNSVTVTVGMSSCSFIRMFIRSGRQGHDTYKK